MPKLGVHPGATPECAARAGTNTNDEAIQKTNLEARFYHPRHARREF
jgi:hypothetical protein